MSLSLRSCTRLTRWRRLRPRRSSLQTSIVSTPRSDCMSCPRVCMEIATGASDGPNNVAGNSMRVGSSRSFRSSPRRGSATKRLEPPTTTFKKMAIGCATLNSRPWGCAPPPEWWKPDAKTPSGLDSNDPGCIGVCGEPIPSWPFVALDSVDALRIFGNGGPITEPQHDPVVTFLSCTRAQAPP